MSHYVHLLIIAQKVAYEKAENEQQQNLNQLTNKNLLSLIDQRSCTSAAGHNAKVGLSQLQQTCKTAVEVYTL